MSILQSPQVTLGTARVEISGPGRLGPFSEAQGPLPAQTLQDHTRGDMALPGATLSTIGWGWSQVHFCDSFHAVKSCVAYTVKTILPSRPIKQQMHSLSHSVLQSLCVFFF